MFEFHNVPHVLFEVVGSHAPVFGEEGADASVIDAQVPFSRPVWKSDEDVRRLFGYHVPVEVEPHFCGEEQHDPEVPSYDAEHRIVPRGRDVVERALRLVSSVLHVAEKLVVWVESEIPGSALGAVLAASGVGGEEGELDAKLVQGEEDGLVVVEGHVCTYRVDVRKAGSALPLRALRCYTGVLFPRKGRLVLDRPGGVEVASERSLRVMVGDR